MSATTLTPERRTQLGQYLQGLSIGYYVVAAVTAFFGLIPIIHVVLGIGMITGGFPPTGGAPAPDLTLMGMLFAGVGATLVLLMQGMAATFLFAARHLAARRGRTFLMVAAAIACLNQPLGIIVGILTFVVLFQPGVQELFDEAADDPVLA